jgi:hypothetical protein
VRRQAGLLGFGQPVGAVAQFASVVEDLERAMRDLFYDRLLVERTDEQERVYTEIYRAAAGWDGRNPFRRG